MKDKVSICITLSV